MKQEKIQLEDKEITKNTLEKGDEVIPKHNLVYEKRNTVIIDDKEKVIANYSLLCEVKGVAKDIFVVLTPNQAKQLKKKIEAGIEINQYKFEVYNYVNDFGPQLGLGFKREEKPAITF